MIEEKAKRNAIAYKMNAARASHPSRIVVANILPAVFRMSERASRTGARGSAQSDDVRPRFAPRVFPVQRFHPALEGRISLEAATPGHQFTGSEPDFPR
jgi:hypothetical protein